VSDGLGCARRAVEVDCTGLRPSCVPDGKRILIRLKVVVLANLRGRSK
jgi:hypothetical protein